MRVPRVAALLGLVALVAAACNHQSGRAAPVAATESAAIRPADVATVLREHGFTVAGEHPSDPPAMFALESNDATVDGTEAGIATFGTVQGREAWLEMIAGFGRAAVVGSGDKPGDLWGVNPVKEQGGLALAAKIARAMGGHTTPQGQ
jgi:hypothetical protein